MSKARTLHRILDYAIAKEELAYETYEKAKSLTTDETMIMVLDVFAKREKWHREKLEIIKKSHNCNESVIIPFPSIEWDTDEDAAHVASFTSFGQLFTFAITAEQKAATLYEQLANEVAGSESRRLFLSLSADEKRHEQKLYELAQYLGIDI